MLRLESRSDVRIYALCLKGVWVRRSECCLEDVRGALDYLGGMGETAFIAGQVGQVEEGFGDVGMMLAESSFTNAERAFVERLGVVAFALHSRRVRTPAFQTLTTSPVAVVIRRGC